MIGTYYICLSIVDMPKFDSKCFCKVRCTNSAIPTYMDTRTCETECIYSMNLIPDLSHACMENISTAGHLHPGNNNMGVNISFSPLRRGLLLRESEKFNIHYEMCSPMERKHPCLREKNKIFAPFWTTECVLYWRNPTRQSTTRAAAR